MRQTARLILQKQDYVDADNDGDSHINEDSITTYSPRVLKASSNHLFTSSYLLGEETIWRKR
jgi:hypothetical protein